MTKEWRFEQMLATKGKMAEMTTEILPKGYALSWCQSILGYSSLSWPSSCQEGLSTGEANFE